jgi:hypothetical protein
MMELGIYALIGILLACFRTSEVDWDNCWQNVPHRGRSWFLAGIILIVPLWPLVVLSWIVQRIYYHTRK